MSSIEFEEPQLTMRTIDISSAVTHNTPLLIKYGLMKDLASANIAMWILVATFFTAAILIFIFRPSSDEVKYREDFSQYELNHMLPDMLEKIPSRPKTQ